MSAPTEDEIDRLEKAASDAGVDHVLVWYRDQIAVLQVHEQPYGEFYSPERHGRRCVDHPRGDHELVCLTCMEATTAVPEEKV